MSGKTNNVFSFIRISERLNQRQEKFIRLSNSHTNCPLVLNHADCRHIRGGNFRRHTFHNERLRIQSFSLVRPCTYATVNAFSMKSHVFASFHMKMQNRENSEMTEGICKWHRGTSTCSLPPQLVKCSSSRFPYIKFSRLQMCSSQYLLMQITKIIHLYRSLQRPITNVLRKEDQRKTNQNKTRVFNTPALSISPTKPLKMCVILPTNKRGKYCLNPFPSRPTPSALDDTDRLVKHLKLKIMCIFQCLC